MDYKGIQLRNSNTCSMTIHEKYLLNVFVVWLITSVHAPLTWNSSTLSKDTPGKLSNGIIWYHSTNVLQLLVVSKKISVATTLVHSINLNIFFAWVGNFSIFQQQTKGLWTISNRVEDWRTWRTGGSHFQMSFQLSG